MTISVERLLAGTPKERLEAMCGEVCAHADDLFEGSQARFVFVVWPEGFEGEVQSFAVFAQPQAQPVAVKALETAAEALRGLSQ
ncbi:hypothetical protein [Brevundimonas sp. LjRoot202]|uniref:hypothetical protein n=1 Tax=Brevundimonas sp. LjRoot202 TaxID=3342281 RepID=UPI003ECF6854